MDNRTPEPLLALWLAEEAARRGDPLVHVARSDARLTRLLGPAQAFAGETVEILALPAWDVLPYDPARPSAAVVGQRLATLLALARPATRPRLVLTSADAVLQRVPPPGTWEGAAFTLRAGDALDLEGLRHHLAALGYRAHEEVHEPGEVAVRGEVVDLWPTGAAEPVRLDVAEGRIAAMRHFDPLPQRSTGPVDAVWLLPAVEFPPDEEEANHLLRAEDEAPPPEPPARLVPLSALLPSAGWVLDPEVEERWHAFAEQVEDAFAATSKARRVAAAAGTGALPRPSRLYVAPEQAVRAAAARIEAAPGGGPAEAPRSTMALVARLREAGAGVVVLACSGDPVPVVRSLARRGVEARAAADWQEALAGGIAAMRLDVAEGFERPGLLVLPIAGLVHAARRQLGHGPALEVPALEIEEGPRVGDLVVHAEHGVARLRGLTLAEGEERVALQYADEADLLAEPWELSQVWRLGGEAARMSPDRLGGEAWQRTRAELEAEVAAAAERLTQLAEARTRQTAPRIEVGPAYARLAHRFAYAPSTDQQAAFDAVLADLASGRPMDRLVCGDVGFGKTEVALRAAAAAALAGWQVAVAAPTTVLARQHLEGFRRRFAGTVVRVEGLIRGAATPEGRRVRKGLADGSVGVVVGTQALAAEGVRFKRLGLVVVDEEQRFGEAVKDRLAHLGQGVHLLTMTATPIPRTLQAALVGLRDCSVIATAPVRRQPTRTFVLPWDPVVAREALLREKARGGQGFVVVPRIEALRRVEEELRALVPELSLRVAHGKLAPEALDEAVTGFARGEGDVLLATNIIEAGLDIPRANLILVREAERFGLAQLHQLRGRVGRGARRGAAYFMAAPGKRLTAATAARLRTLEALTDLGAGAALSAADLDLRGGGDLFGTAQAGHLRRVGTEMYQELLAQALTTRRGAAAVLPAAVHGLPAGRFPQAWVPEENLRLTLLRRLARLRDPAALDEFGAELADRFGEPPREAIALLDQARLRLVAGIRGVAALEVGPKGVALTFRKDFEASLARLVASLDGKKMNDRVIIGANKAPLARVLEEYLPI
jgi:transcription-repair coupling factor (superfamily II helicase)